jgi:hypothetical protein
MSPSRTRPRLGGFPDFLQNSTIVRFILFCLESMSVTQPVSKAAAPRSKDVVRDGGREGRALLKGQQTKAAIVDAALAWPRRSGWRA